MPLISSQITNGLRRRSRSLSSGNSRTKQIYPKNNSFHTPEHKLSNIIMGNSVNKVSVEKVKKGDRGAYLESDKILKILAYFNYSGVISHGLDDYLQVSDFC